MNVTIEKFLESWCKNQPSKYERFYYKYFSEYAENKKLSMIVTIILIVPFLLGYVGTIFNADYNFLKMVTLLFSIIVVILVVPGFYILHVHNKRIKKIIKELNCTKKEYDIAVKKFGHLIK
jgi:intracellular septation protein A